MATFTATFRTTARAIKSRKKLPYALYLISPSGMESLLAHVATHGDGCLMGQRIAELPRLSEGWEVVLRDV